MKLNDLITTLLYSMLISQTHPQLKKHGPLKKALLAIYTLVTLPPIPLNTSADTSPKNSLTKAIINSMEDTPNSLGNQIDPD